jgi:ATP synthase protein I
MGQQRGSMKKPHQSGPNPGEGRDPLARLDSDLASFEASRQKASSGLGNEAGAGYRLLGQMLGGVLGGIGLGWLVDHFAHTSPWGVVLGLLIGAGLSIYSAVRTASRMGERAGSGKGPPAPPGPDDDEDD